MDRDDHKKEYSRDCVFGGGGGGRGFRGNIRSNVTFFQWLREADDDACDEDFFHYKKNAFPIKKRASFPSHWELVEFHETHEESPI